MKKLRFSRPSVKVTRMHRLLREAGGGLDMAACLSRMRQELGTAEGPGAVTARDRPPQGEQSTSDSKLGAKE